MANGTVVDAGPMVAIVHRDDEAHRRCVESFRTITTPLLTVWPAVTEALCLLNFDIRAQDTLLAMLERGVFSVAPLTEIDVPRIRDLMNQYADLPMDFADAALVRVAEREGISRVFTVDSDFRVYSPRHASAFEVIP